MDFGVKKSCPNCSQYFSLPDATKQSKGNHLPLMLHCGHPICYDCLNNIIKFKEPIECKICRKPSELSAEDMDIICKKPKFILGNFPIDKYTVGQLYLNMVDLQALETGEEPRIEKEYFIDIKSLLSSLKQNFGECVECHTQTTKMCKNCSSVLCQDCFKKIHSAFQTFKHHIYKNIDSKLDQNFCSTHEKKCIEYYCQECNNRPMCMDCVMLTRGENCKEHALISAEDMHSQMIEELKTISPKLDQTLRRLSGTALDIGYLLKSFENLNNASKCDMQKIINNVLNHFSKLHGIVQKYETEAIDKLLRLKSQQKMSVVKAKEDTIANIKELQGVINKINAILNDSTNVAQVNIASILEAAKKAENIPWYLCKGEGETSNPVISVKEEICSEVGQYVSIEGGSTDGYKLLCTGDVTGEIKPAPAAILYPPELLKDVREAKKTKTAPIYVPPPVAVPVASIPKFRPRFGSNKSINSTESGNSQKKIQSVEPFNAKRNQNSLTEGSQELVFISHVVDPHNFYVQRVSDQDLVKEIIREYSKAFSGSKPYPEQIQPGKLFAAYCESVKKWQRAKVLRILKKESGVDVYEVLFIDFGNTDYVSINELRLIPPERHNPKPLALHCRMANIRPIDTWNSKDSLLMIKIVDNKQAVIYVRHVHQKDDDVTYECDLATFEDGVNVAKAFVFYGKGLLINPNLQYPPLGMSQEKPKIFYSYSDFNNKKTLYDVIFTNIESPDKFWVRKLVLQDTYLKLSEDLQHSYTLKHEKRMIHCPEEGMMCVVNVDDEPNVSGGGWRRAVVTGWGSPRTVTLRLLDTGEGMPADVHHLRRIHDRHTTLDALAVECHLHGVTPLNKKWSTGSLALMNCFRSSRLSMRVEECNPRTLSVLLYADTADGDMLCINTEMVHKRYAITIGMCNFKLSKEEQVFTKNIPQIDKKPKPKKQREKAISILRKNVPQPSAKTDDKVKETPNTHNTSLDAKDKGPIKLEVKMLHCESPSLLYISLLDQEKQMKELYADLQEYFCEDKSEPKQDWKVGDKCCALCKESKTFRRAKILAIKDEIAELFFSDFAVYEKVPLDALKELPKCFSAIRDAAIKCHLSGVIPGAGDTWPYLTIEHLKDRLESYRRFFITRKGVMKDDSLPVELWVYHITQGGPLEPNKAEWRCLNQDIIDNGLGIPDRTNDKPRDSEDYSLSFLDLPGTIHDYLKPETSPDVSLAQMMEEIKLQYQPVKTTPKSDIEENISDCEICENASENDSVGCNFDILKTTPIDPNDWLPAENFSTTQFYGIITHVNEAFVLFVQEDIRRDKLQLLRTLMAKHAATGVDDPTPPKVGDLCLSKFFVDNQLYRGKIRAVDPDRRLLRVHYADYGNTETCRYHDVLPVGHANALRKIPAQARRCALAHLSPSPPTSRWTTDVLQYVHQIVVDKKCFFRVLGDKTATVVPVEIKVEDKFWLHEHLLEFDLARRDPNWKERVAKMPIEDIEVETQFETASPERVIAEVETEAAVESKSESGESSVDNQRNWVDMMDEESRSAQDEHDVTQEFYSDREIEDRFWCTISAINSFEILNLIVEEPDEETKVMYEQMTEDLQENAASQPVLDEAFEKQACVAKFPTDGRWYRARVLESSEREKLLKVQFVDFGDREVLPISEVRRTRPAWTVLPPAVIQATLANISSVNISNKEGLVAAFAETFMDKRFFAKVVRADVEPIVVELRTDEDGELAYQNLIDKEFFLVSNEE